MSLVEVVELDQFYGDLQALFGISLRVDEGEIVAIIGANGAGKSTLLKTIAGLLSAPAHSVRFDGEPIAGTPAYLRVSRGISLVPEGRRVFPSLSVQENLVIGSFGRRLGAWDLVGVYDLFPMLARISKRSAAVLSGGEQQALAIGRALMSNPRLLLMDEISLGLAPVVVKSLYEAVPTIAASGTTLIVVEQDVSQALRIADRAYCLLEGRISLQGKASELGRDQILSASFGV